MSNGKIDRTLLSTTGPAHKSDRIVMTLAVLSNVNMDPLKTHLKESAFRMSIVAHTVSTCSNCWIVRHRCIATTSIHSFSTSTERAV